MSEGALFIFDGSQEGRVLLPSGRGGHLRVCDLEKFQPLLDSHGRVSRTPDCDAWGLLSTGAASPAGYEFASRRDLPAFMSEDLFVRSGAAFQMMSLYVNNKFCGKCGEPMRDHTKENARECPECGRIVFPSLAPAVIVAVERDGMLLLGHNANFPEGRYSVLAGFVEPGETLEQTVAREVYEESRIKVKNIRYFGNQPWPFPASMMLGFRAEWRSGEPYPDGEEVTDVRWFSPDQLPALPQSVSISRKLIDAWLERVRRRARHRSSRPANSKDISGNL